MEVSFTVDAEDVLRMINAGDEIYRKAAARVLTREGTSLRARTLRRVSAKLNVPRKHLARRARFRRASVTVLESKLTLFTQPLNPIRLGAIQDHSPGGGVSASGHTWPGAFIARGKGKNRLVFKREAKPRLPLDVMKIPWQADADAALEAELQVTSRDITERLWKDIEWRLANA